MMQVWNWVKNRPNLCGAALVSAVHFSLAIVYKYRYSISMASYDWDMLWQTIPTQALRHDLLENLFYFHANPPLYNTYAAVFFRLFYPDHMTALHLGNIVLGSLSVGLIFFISYHLSSNWVLAAFTALVVAFHPGLIILEAYPLYTLLAMFLVVLCVSWIVFYQRHKKLWYLYAFLTTLNVLVLTRSLYHPVLILFGIVFAAYLAVTQWRRLLIVGSLISLITVFWLVKNGVVFGFVGTSSWTGANIWRVVRARYSAEELQSFVDEGMIEPFHTNRRTLLLPSDYKEYGFDEVSDIEALNRDDRHNINIVAASKTYMDASLNVIKHDPSHFLGNIILAYNRYSCPSIDLKYLQDNVVRLHRFHKTLYRFTQAEDAVSCTVPIVDEPVCSANFFVIPLVIAASTLFLLGQLIASRWRLRAVIQDHAALLVTVAFILYTTVVGSAAEYGENNRFKFMIEPLLWLLVLLWTYKLLRYTAAAVIARFQLNGYPKQ
ncbi:MAG: hypothetical protein JW966_09665 [Anaerolineae bacterium]|nr:hypothetical protein [Anaerolineae bacterium]